MFICVQVMQNDAAVFRTQGSLEEGCRNIDETVASFADVKVRSRRPMYNMMMMRSHVQQMNRQSIGQQCLLCGLCAAWQSGLYGHTTALSLLGLVYPGACLQLYL
jgi:hypothetical protein